MTMNELLMFKKEVNHFLGSLQPRIEAMPGLKPKDEGCK